MSTSFHNLSAVRITASGQIRDGASVRLWAIYAAGSGLIECYNGASNAGELLLALDVVGSLEYAPGGAVRFPEHSPNNTAEQFPVAAGTAKRNVAHGGLYVELGAGVTSATLILG